MLQAQPGAGKTTRVPLALCREPWLGDQQILMLEPRRLAARSCAHYMAEMLNESVGKTVGYRIRMENKSAPSTRILIITEGILTRMIQSDPSLEGTGLVIFDEFHERHIHSDLGLALSLEASAVFRPDLRILVMSATMDVGAVSGLMDNAPVIQSTGKVFPVATAHVLPRPVQGGPSFFGFYGPFSHILDGCIKAVETALDNDPGDILVFLPGQSEIRQVQRVLCSRAKADTLILPLYGALSLKAQTRAISLPEPGKRKVVLSTSLAETSLTIEGIRVVVDAGLMRLPRFFPGTGMSRLETVPVSKASADQRRGRAGRTDSGTCYRIWSAHVHKGLVPYTRPEILSEDLAPLVLELALWGVTDPNELKWLDPPPDAGVSQARELLESLGALDRTGRITDHGRKMARSGVHPRLARMILKAEERGIGDLACWLAALLESSDIMDFYGNMADPDIRLRLEVLEKIQQNPDKMAGKDVKMGPARNVLKTAGFLQKKMKINSGKPDINQAGALLAFAYPDRVAQKRQPLSYVMASGGGACFKSVNSISEYELIVAAQVDGNPRNAAIFLGAPYALADLMSDFKDALTTIEDVTWDQDRLMVRAVRRTCYQHLVLKEAPMEGADPGKVTAALIKGVRLMGINRLAWTKKAESFRWRVVFLREKAGQTQLPDLSDSGLARGLEIWLAPFLDGIRSAAGLKKVDLFSALTALISFKDRQFIEKNAPTHIQVPSGAKIALSYSDAGRVLDAPVLAARVQQMFGLARTPEVCGIPLTIQLLSPAGRPVQITRDLENFWANTYKEVKKDLMGRYPKHAWPDDPGKG